MIEVRVLGGFGVRHDDVAVPPFPRHDAASLVKLLALSPQHRLPCERVVDALWPDLLLEEARPRLHKAAHYARRTVGSAEAVVLRGNWATLGPELDVVVDLDVFEAAAAEALSRDHASRPAACAAAAALCGGELLPQDAFEPWLAERRNAVHRQRLAVLRGAGQWDAVLELDPADEVAHLALLRAAVDAGDRTAALRHYDRMSRALSAELGIPPGPEAVALRDRALAFGPRSSGSNAAPVPRRRPGRRQLLLEREAELEHLHDLVDEVATTGQGLVVLVGGEAGSGKTSLVGALLDQLAGEVTVLQGHCDDLLAPRSLGPFRDIAQAVPGVLADALAAGGDPESVFPALLHTLAAGPTLLVIEDVQWADDATIDAARFLAHRLDGLPVLLLLTCREDEVARDHPLRRLLGSLSAAALRRVPARPLSLAAVSALAGGRSDPGQLHRVTRGNAFFVTEVLAAGGSGVPSTVRDAVLARLARVSADGRSLVQRLAVIPSRADRALVEQLSDGRLEPVVDAERAGVLSGDAASVWFRHELARVAVVSTLTSGERVAAHRQVLGALLDQPAPDLARVIHHAQAAGRSDVLARYGPTVAVDAARAGAHRQAADTLRLVIEAGAERDPATLAALCTARAYSLYAVNRFEEAFCCATEAVRRAELTGDPIPLADALSVLSKTAFWARGPLAARRASGRAVTSLEAVGDEARLAGALTDLARAHSNLATVGVVSEPGAAAICHAERALAVADRLGRDDLRAQALAYLGSSRLADGDDRGAQDLDRAIRLASTDPRGELGVRACVNAAGSAYRRGRFDEAEEYVALGLRLADRVEFFGGRFRLRLTQAALRASSGQWDDAIDGLQGLLAQPGDPAAMGVLARALLARLLGRRGEHRTAAEVLAGAGTFAGGLDDIFVAGPLAAAATELAWLRGDVPAMPALAADALAKAAEAGHRGSRSELCRYLQRGGHRADVPEDALGPWAPALGGRTEESAAAWAALGERYEEAVELALTPSSAVRSRGLTALDRLGASATSAVLRSADAGSGAGPWR